MRTLPGVVGSVAGEVIWPVTKGSLCKVYTNTFCVPYMVSEIMYSWSFDLRESASCMLNTPT